MYLDMETVLFRPRLIRLISPHIFMGDWKQNIEILVQKCHTRTKQNYRL